MGRVPGGGRHRRGTRSGIRSARQGFHASRVPTGAAKEGPCEEGPHGVSRREEATWLNIQEYWRQTQNDALPVGACVFVVHRPLFSVELGSEIGCWLFVRLLSSGELSCVLCVCFLSGRATRSHACVPSRGRGRVRMDSPHPPPPTEDANICSDVPGGKCHFPHTSLGCRGDIYGCLSSSHGAAVLLKSGSIDIVVGSTR